MSIKLFSLMRLLLPVSLIAVILSTQIAPANIVAVAASREPVRARHGIVASTNEIASNVGVDIMKRGGNAVDAAIAVALLWPLRIQQPAISAAAVS